MTHVCCILHDRIPQDGASPDHQDVLVQVESVNKALQELGYQPIVLSTSLNLSALRAELLRIRPSFVFNLVESLAGHGRLIYLPPALLDCLGIPYTGAGTDAIYLTTSKLAAKEALRAYGIRTPQGFSRKDLERGSGFLPGPYIIKSIWEHASIGLDEESVVEADLPGQLLLSLQEREEKLGVSCFAEAYIEGREFNLSMLAGSKGAQVLPPAEIRFEDYPGNKRRIVGYRAKWHESSFEYIHTVRSFEFPETDQALLRSLSLISIDCWDRFHLRGYARVDFRVDERGRPWVLEINANPCLSPDAGFAAAAQKAGLSFTEVVRRIIGDCEFQRNGGELPHGS